MRLMRWVFSSFCKACGVGSSPLSFKTQCHSEIISGGGGAAAAGSYSSWDTPALPLKTKDQNSV